jgi:hypothetical protein
MKTSTGGVTCSHPSLCDNDHDPLLLTIIASNTRINVSIVGALDAMATANLDLEQTPSISLNVDLSFNGYTSIPLLGTNSLLTSINLSFNNITSVLDGTFASAAVLESIDMSNNKITAVAVSAFFGASGTSSSNLMTINLSNNFLTILPVGASVAIPFFGLQVMDLSGNQLLSYPRPLDPAINVENNPLRCPPITVVDYTTAPSDQLASACNCTEKGLNPFFAWCANYVMCLNNTWGCGGNKRAVFSTTCNNSNSPWPECMTMEEISQTGKYYYSNTMSLHNISVCSQLYPQVAAA